ncbi:HTH DNA binding domain protein [Candidatus Bilamarchaeum dharawalense]|uniref:HTH DNA binding domain protein n=1 Tax=Candidatus Bilamarchaeum dharawalense TaxID=2885759 RepID=A0A5E4LTF0_9ARCH|nr:HTH DNA binding domain protein [Candidatus Bilamarchaeum dharawalense]
MFKYGFRQNRLMKFCEIGVYHHDCWFTDAINKFPELQVREISARICELGSGVKINRASYRIFTPNKECIGAFVNQISSSVSEAKVLASDAATALVEVTWKASKTSYDAILGSGCAVTSACYGKDGYETYSLFTDTPDETRKLLGELEQIGEVRTFSIKNTPNGNRKFGLTPKQQQAIVSAISMGYYEWPKQANLEELAARLGVKRRALQENLRKAESKVLGGMLDQLHM